jgi:hypothetical protein
MDDGTRASGVGSTLETNGRSAWSSWVKKGVTSGRAIYLPLEIPYCVGLNPWSTSTRCPKSDRVAYHGPHHPTTKSFASGIHFERRPHARESALAQCLVNFWKGRRNGCSATRSDERVYTNTYLSFWRANAMPIPCQYHANAERHGEEQFVILPRSWRCKGLEVLVHFNGELADKVQFTHNFLQGRRT